MFPSAYTNVFLPTKLSNIAILATRIPQWTMVVISMSACEYFQVLFPLESFVAAGKLAFQRPFVWLSFNMALTSALMVKSFEADAAFKSKRLCLLVVYIILIHVVNIIFWVNTIREMCIGQDPIICAFALLHWMGLRTRELSNSISCCNEPYAAAYCFLSAARSARIFFERIWSGG